MTASLPREMERCLQRHAGQLLQQMEPDGVFLYLSGAQVMEPQDLAAFRHLPADDVWAKNHVLINVVSRKGRKGFSSFMDALETTQQLDLVQKVKATLNENLSNTTQMKNDNEIVSSPQVRSFVPSTNTVSSVARPTVASSSSFVSRSLTTATPVTPPLTEAEFKDHIARLTALLRTISTTHCDVSVRKDAEDLIGEIHEQGESMLDRVGQLSKENMEKDQELRRAKYMVRGLEAQIAEIKSSPPGVPSTQSRRHPSYPDPPAMDTARLDRARKIKANKSDVCGIL